MDNDLLKIVRKELQTALDTYEKSVDMPMGDVIPGHELKKLLIQQIESMIREIDQEITGR